MGNVFERLKCFFAGHRGSTRNETSRHTRGNPETGAIAAAMLATLFLSTALAGQAAAAQCGDTASPGLDWRECSKKNLMLQGSNLEGADLYSIDFSMTDLSNANLSAANLEKARLLRSWLTGAKADKANFTKIEAYRSSFANVSANGAVFSGAELQRSDFSGAQLNGANFEKAELGRANFKEADLTDARFSFANLSRADLSKATFKGALRFDNAFLFLTRIEGLDLSKATGLAQPQVDLACGNAETTLPDGLSAPGHWPCPFD